MRILSTLGVGWLALASVLFLAVISTMTGKEVAATADNSVSDLELSTHMYFHLLRQYFGDELFESYECLVEQEKNGWKTYPYLQSPLQLHTTGPYTTFIL